MLDEGGGGERAEGRCCVKGGSYHKKVGRSPHSKKHSSGKLINQILIKISEKLFRKEKKKEG
jgi:hypothetical protein